MSAQASSYTPITGVFPVLPTPFDDAGALDATGLRTLVRYLLVCGVDGITLRAMNPSRCSLRSVSVSMRWEMSSISRRNMPKRLVSK